MALSRLRILVFLGILVLGTWHPPNVLSAESTEESSRFCYGFLYCREIKGDTTTTQAFLYAYSTEERGTFSRLTVIPFYSREMDPSKNYSRRSVLWPLGISETLGNASYFQIFPLYWNADDPTRHYTFILPLYFDYAKDNRSYTHLIPLYGHHVQGLTYHRYFLLGPVAIASYDKQINLKEWDVLFPFFHYETDNNGSATRLLPFYFSGESRQDGSWYRHVLPVYGRSVTAQSDLGYLFPLYGTLTDTSTQARRTSVFGLPPISQSPFPTLALYEHASSSAVVSDRLFPLYRYSHTLAQDLSQLDIIVLFQLRTGPALTAHRLFPVYSYENDQSQNHFGWSLLGYEEFSFAGYGHAPSRAWQHFFPLYRSTEDLTTQTRDTSVLGIGPLSLLRYWSTPAGLGHRFFPIYFYDHPATEEWHWSALIPGSLSLYRHDAEGTNIRDRFIPLYDWRRKGDWREFSLLGISDFSMFYQESGPTRFANRLFPVYRYRHDLAADDTTMETLFLHRHHFTPERADDRFLFLWDATWQRQQPVWELDLFGLKPFTWFHYESSPLRTANRLFPVYGYQSSPSDAWQLSLLGFPPRGQAFAWSLYEHGQSPTYFLTRLFPLYRYERNDETKEVKWSALLLYRHKETETHLVDTFPPLHEYERDDRTGKTELNLVGLKPITLFAHGTAPNARRSYLFPLYDHDRIEEASRLSLIGWPKMGTLPTLALFEMEETPSLSAHRFFPLYRYRRDDQAKTRDWDGLLLWWHRENEQRLRDIFLPLVDIWHDRQRDQFEVGVLGIRPLTFFQYQSSPSGISHSAVLLYKYSMGERQRLSALGLPHFDRGPALSLFDMQQTDSLTSHRFFPVYQYAKDEQAHTMNWQALLLWWHRQTDTHSRNIFLPLSDVERDSAAQSHRVSLVGLPRMGTLPALTLFNWEQTPSLSSHRFFPLYQYADDQTQNAMTWNVLWLYWHHSDPAQARDTFFPLGSWRREPHKEAWSVSAAGVEPVSLAHFAASQSGVSNRFSPLWDYEREGNDWGLSFIGIRRLSFFSHEITADTTTDHLFPLWWHEDSPTESNNIILPLWSDLENRKTQERQLSVFGIGPVSLYYQQRSSTGMTARIFPAWSYQYEEATQESHTGVVGIPPMSLYYGHTTPTMTENRLFPFFRYTSDRVSNESEFWFLWPFFDHKMAQDRTTEISVLWGLFQYRSPKADEWEYWVMGHPPIAMYMRVVSPTRTLVEVNPIIPGWRREYVEGVGTSWAVLGGLVGMDAMPDGSHALRLFWMKKDKEKEGT